MISLSSTLKVLADQIKAFLPPQGYETLMPLRRVQRLHGQPTTIPSIKEEPPKPGDIIEYYENGKWIKVKWPAPIQD